MIRAVTVLSLLVLLVLVLYVPSAHPPGRFLAQLRTWQEEAIGCWGAEPATRMLDRAMRMQDSTAQVTPIPAAKDAPSPAGVNGGESGAPNRYTVRRNGETIAPSTFHGKIANFQRRPGDIVVMESSGGGGLGDARKRSRALVEADVKSGVVSLEAAERDYSLDS